MQAAVGLAQLDKLPAFIEKRQENWHRLYQGLKELEEFFILPEIPPQAEASPFGFVLTIRDGAPFNRQQITNFLEERKIQTRTVFAGNIIRQPAFTESTAPYRVAGELKNTDKVMNDTFWIGVYPGLTAAMLDYMIEEIREFVGGTRNEDKGARKKKGGRTKERGTRTKERGKRREEGQRSEERGQRSEEKEGRKELNNANCQKRVKGQEQIGDD